MHTPPFPLGFRTHTTLSIPGFPYIRNSQTRPCVAFPDRPQHKPHPSAVRHSNMSASKFIRSEDHPVFKHRKLTKEIVAKLQEKTEQKAGNKSILQNRAAGNKLKWFSDTFITQRGRESAVFPAWVNANDEPLQKWKAKDGKPPILNLSFPPGPTEFALLTMDAVYKFDADKADSKMQKFHFQSDFDQIDQDMYKDWIESVRYVDHFMNIERAHFLAHNIDKHDMLTPAEREETDPKELTKSIVKAMKTKGNNTHHWLNITRPRVRIFRNTYSDDADKIAKAGGISEADLVTLSSMNDPEGHVRRHLASSKGKLALRLINLYTYDLQQVHPDEYKHIKGRDGCVQVDVAYYGINCRLEKGEPSQHSVKVGITSAQLLNNGVDGGREGSAADCSDIFGDGTHIDTRSQSPDMADVDPDAEIAKRKEQDAEEEELTRVKRLKTGGDAIAEDSPFDD